MVGPGGGRLMRRQLSLPEVRSALIRNKGLRSAAARDLDCSRGNIDEWLKRHPELRASVHEVEGPVTDAAAANVMTAIKNKNLSASMFWLRSKGADLGFGDKVQVEQNVTHRHEVSFKELTEDEIVALRDSARAQLAREGMESGEGGDGESSPPIPLRSLPSH